MMTITFCCNDEKTLRIVERAIGNSIFSTRFDYWCKTIDCAEDFERFDVMISPANSFGELLGGFDMQYYKHFGGKKLQTTIYDSIRRRHHGEILIGDYCAIRIVIPRKNDKVLVLCPTMTIPMDVSGTRNAYYFMRAVLTAIASLQAKGYPCENVFCPIPCVGVGNMSPNVVAKQMRVAIDAVNGIGDIHAIFPSGDDDNVLQNARRHFISILS